MHSLGLHKHMHVYGQTLAVLWRTLRRTLPASTRSMANAGEAATMKATAASITRQAPAVDATATTSPHLRLSKRCINTPVNVLVCGASGTGKSTFISTCAQLLSPNDAQHPEVQAAQTDDGVLKPSNPATDQFGEPHMMVLASPDAFTTTITPILAHEACRSVVYKFQDFPGHGSTLYCAGYLEALVTFIMQQQEKDYQELLGSTRVHKSVARGCLTHSITACIYVLSPGGPSSLDLVLLSGLSKHVTVLPVVGKADCMTETEAKACIEAVQHMLSVPDVYVPGLKRIHMYSPSTDANMDSPGSVIPLMLHTRSSAVEAAAGMLSRPDWMFKTTAEDADNQGLVRLLEMLTGDEVYGLLDKSWELYTQFCIDYESTSKRLDRLIKRSCEQSVQPFLPACLAAVQRYNAVVRLLAAGDRAFTQVCQQLWKFALACRGTAHSCTMEYCEACTQMCQKVPKSAVMAALLCTIISLVIMLGSFVWPKRSDINNMPAAAAVVTTCDAMIGG